MKNIRILVLGSLMGCASFGSFKPGASAAADRARAAVECRVDALKPYLGDQAEQWVLEIAAGRVNAAQLLLNLDLSVADVIKIAKAFDACSDNDAGPEASPPVEPTETL